MSLPDKNDITLNLKYISNDSGSRPVYEDQYGRLWKDVTLGIDHSDLYSSFNNAFDREPDLPIRKSFVIQSSENLAWFAERRKTCLVKLGADFRI